MRDVLAGLEPRTLWGYFSALCEIPRPSKREERVVEWVRELARSQDWSVDHDSAGNLVVRVPGSSGRESAPPVILQAHLDMVGEKNRDVDHDFDSDPIRARLDGEWVGAEGTTLGADNGIGVAAALAAAADGDVVHGPLELLLTLDEETGLTGAQNLDPSLLRGRLLINLDSEEDGKLFVGCSGGVDTSLRLRLERIDALGAQSLRVEVRGLRGGHSGIDIHQNRGNAIQVLTATLLAAIADGVEIELEGLRGGSKHNAIPREAEAFVRAPAGETSSLREAAKRTAAAFGSRFAGIEEGLTIEVTEGSVEGRVLDRASRDRLCDLLSVLPHGVLAMSRELPGLVETSSNLASVRADSQEAHIVTSTRSSVVASQEAVVQSIRAAARLAGARSEVYNGYPGWKPNLDSPLLDVVRSVYAEQLGRAPEVTAVHAGLECGLLGEKLPDVDMISFGPQIEGAHSPDERVHIGSVNRFWSALVGVLDKLSRT